MTGVTGWQCPASETPVCCQRPRTAHGPPVSHASARRQTTPLAAPPDADNVKLDRETKLHLRAAEGWLEIGDYISANEELENIAPTRRAHPTVLNLRYRTY